MRLNAEAHAQPKSSEKLCGCGFPPHVGRCQPEIIAPETEESTITSLALIETTPASLVYAPGALAALVDKLKQEVRSQLATLDVSIPKDKARIISLSARVAKAKVKLDEMGADLTEEHRAVVTAVNADRKTMRDDLDAFKVEVRKPVTDLENAEKVRVAAHEAVIHQIEELGKMDRPLNLDEIEARAAQVSILADRDWQEFKQRATGAKVMAMEALSEAQDRALESIRLREELERLRAAEAERAIKEREEAAAKAAQDAAERRAAEQARIAREAAERERQRVENERAEAEARAKQAEAEKIAAELRAEALRLTEAESYQAQLAKERREAAEAEERAQQAMRDTEARRIAEAERTEQLLAEMESRAAAERTRIEQERIAKAEAAERREYEAQQKAERDQIAAVEAERQRVAAQKKAELEEAEKRAKNRAHRGAIHREALQALCTFGMTQEQGKELIESIAKNEIPHISIQY